MLFLLLQWLHWIGVDHFYLLLLIQCFLQQFFTIFTLRWLSPFPILTETLPCLIWGICWGPWGCRLINTARDSTHGAISIVTMQNFIKSISSLPLQQGKIFPRSNYSSFPLYSISSQRYCKLWVKKTATKVSPLTITMSMKFRTRHKTKPYQPPSHGCNMKTMTILA